MSQLEEEEIEEVEKRLIEEVLKNPSKYPDEAKMILLLETWSRQGEAFCDTQSYEVVQGEVGEVVLEEFDEGYPYRSGAKIALIPLSIPTVIDLYRYDDTTDPPVKSRTLYVFTSEGWKSVKVY
jgi:hypothetical protein